MKIRDLMSRDAKIADRNQSIRDIARLMMQEDIGCLPVSNGERLVGMITDRDIAVRAVAEGMSPDTPVSEVMTTDVKYCFDDEDADHVAMNMGDIQVRRLPVVDRDKRLVGVLSLCDLALRTQEPDVVGKVVAGISKPGGQHSQTMH